MAKVERERNAAKSSRDILNAAEDCFAEKGFYGARIDEIALRANINKRMIYEYYGSKENLYKQVLFTVYKRMEDVESAILNTDLQGEDLIRSIINNYFDFLRDNPTFISLVMRENLSHASYLNELPPETLRRKSLQVLAQRISLGIEQGIFKADVDPVQTVVSLNMVCFANFSNRFTLPRLFEQDIEDENILNTRKNHTIAMMLSYLCNGKDK